MNDKVFRAKSLERIQSPENLNEYIRVSDPAVWLLLVAVIVLLAGALVWSVFGRIDSVIKAHTQVEDGVALCYIDEGDAAVITDGMPVRLADAEGVITGIRGFDGDVCVCEVEMNGALEDGLYACEIVTERIRPISFILN